MPPAVLAFFVQPQLKDPKLLPTVDCQFWLPVISWWLQLVLPRTMVRVFIINVTFYAIFSSRHLCNRSTRWSPCCKRKTFDECILRYILSRDVQTWLLSGPKSLFKSLGFKPDAWLKLTMSLSVFVIQVLRLISVIHFHVERRRFSNGVLCVAFEVNDIEVVNTVVKDFFMMQGINHIATTGILALFCAMFMVCKNSVV